MTTISVLPQPPNTADSTNFTSRADAFFAALPKFVSEANLLTSEVNGFATSAETSANNAAASATSAAAASGASLWVSGTSYSLGAVVYDDFNFQTYRKKTATSISNTRPGLDSTNWVLLTGNIDIDSTQILSNKLFLSPREQRVELLTPTINPNLGSVFTYTVNSTTSFSIDTPDILYTNDVTCFILEITNGGSNLVSWPSSIKWSFGIQPTLTVSGLDILGFYTWDSGSNWRGSVISRNIS